MSITEILYAVAIRPVKSSDLEALYRSIISSLVFGLRCAQKKGRTRHRRAERNSKCHKTWFRLLSLA